MATCTYREDKGGRFVAATNIKGHGVEIAYGYDIHEDKWRYHVYVENKKAGKMTKVPIENPLADSEDEAVAEGVQVAEAVIG